MCPLTPAWSLQGDHPVPMEVRSDALVQRFDLKTTHEGTDVAIPLQVVALADMGCITIKVICDDTDVFVLLAHYFAEEGLSVSLIMESTSRSRSSIDIGATAAKHSGIVPQLIAAHAVPDVTQLVATTVSGKQRLLKPCQQGLS